MAVNIMKIYQLVFVRNLIIEKELIDCNTNVIPIKRDLSIKMIDSEDYKKANLHTY